MTKPIRRAGVIALIPLMLGVGTVFGALVQRSDGGEAAPRQTTVSGTVSILNRAAAPSDRLPGWLLATPAAARLDPARGARLAAVVGDRRYFVVPGRGSSVCLVFVEGDAGSAGSGGTCGGRETLRTSSIYLSQPNADGTATVAGIVSDELTEASAGGAAARVANNVFVLRGATGSIVRLAGDRASLEVDVGLAAPVAPAVTVTTS